MRRASRGGVSRESPKTSTVSGSPLATRGQSPFHNHEIFTWSNAVWDSRRCGVGGGRSPFHGAAAGRRGNEDMSISIVTQRLGTADDRNDISEFEV